jgi:hypothetical protein
LNSTSVRTVSTTHYPGSTTATFQLAPTSIIHPTYPYSTYPYVSQTETGVPSSNSSRIRINRDAKIVIVIIVVFLFLGCSGLLLWCCVFKKGLDRGMLVFLGLRKAPSVSEQRVPLNPSGIGVVESDDPSSFQKPELHSEPAQSGLEANQNVGWSKNHQSSHGILFELDANISRTNITSVRAPSHSYADDVERNLDRHATSSYGPITRNSPRSKIDYQDQDILANATFAAAPNSGPPIPSSTAIEMEFVRAPVNLSNAAHSFSPSEDIGWRYSIGKVKRLEEEEKKIDAEIEKFKRVKDLKEQKFEIQKRLMEAKTGIRDV